MKLSHVSESRSTLVKTGRWTGGSDAWPVLTITVIDDAAVRPAGWWGGSLKCHDIISCGSLTPPLRPGQAFSTWPSPFWGGGYGGLTQSSGYPEKPVRFRGQLDGLQANLRLPRKDATVITESGSLADILVCQEI